VGEKREFGRERSEKVRERELGKGGERE